MTPIDSFRHFLQVSIDFLDARYELCEQLGPEADGKAYADIANQAGNLAARFGLPDLYRQSREFGHQAEYGDVKAYLALCLSAISPAEASPYLDSKAAADYLGISIHSLYGLVELDQLKPHRGPRRTYRFTREMLDAYLCQSPN
jgi:hypothetical protein